MSRTFWEPEGFRLDPCILHLAEKEKKKDREREGENGNEYENSSIPSSAGPCPDVWLAVFAPWKLVNAIAEVSFLLQGGNGC